MNREIIKITVPEEYHLDRIDRFISHYLEIDLSRSFIQRLIRHNNITVNGNYIKQNYKIKSQDIIQIKIPVPEKIDLAPENIPLEIIYEDNSVAVINKPPGLDFGVMQCFVAELILLQHPAEPAFVHAGRPRLIDSETNLPQPLPRCRPGSPYSSGRYLQFLKPGPQFPLSVRRLNNETSRKTLSGTVRWLVSSPPNPVALPKHPVNQPV